jgi:hypothetical protein
MDLGVPLCYRESVGYNADQRDLSNFRRELIAEVGLEEGSPNESMTIRGALRCDGLRGGR